ncbi:homocysteine S-methyltransferase family protein [Pararhodospirillum photometricum]|uniref:5-methyltetrahydrofolate--homocysteine methyltransferase n=1 Tax=Pararhodospirillum photometricum DSM 122 TaxID=1150469 RepID=H6SSE0_PARPM|nr:homocysteine S-methyltransferase family protein [Pararhodospirillum photometricum]CCG07819.1 5-methyltetrahydrofolate--homocysteine methyltransferase [Pararhodospirillum photometricum DSM 122]
MATVRVLDGGMGRELKRRGAPFRQPEWSALALLEGPGFVTLAHQAFLEAGASILTTNSYAVVPFHLGQERFEARGTELAALAGRLAREVADRASPAAIVAGSLPPALGSYRPDLFDEAASIAIHQKLIEGLAPFVDVWLAETQSSIAEVRAARTALGNDPKPLWLSFTLDDEPVAGPVLRSGEPVAVAVEEALALGARAVLFNCSQPEVMGAAVTTAREEARKAGVSLDLGVYANAFPPTPKDAKANETLDELRPDLDPARYAAWAQAWVDQGATIIGGCCGITPEHINALARALK